MLSLLEKKKKKMLFRYMIRQVYDSSFTAMGDMHRDKQWKKNPHRSQRGISLACLHVPASSHTHITNTYHCEHLSQQATK